jgi:hypothetical protein
MPQNTESVTELEENKLWIRNQNKTRSVPQHCKKGKKKKKLIKIKLSCSKSEENTGVDGGGGGDDQKQCTPLFCSNPAENKS